MEVSVFENGLENVGKRISRVASSLLTDKKKINACKKKSIKEYD